MVRSMDFSPMIGSNQATPTPTGPQGEPYSSQNSVNRDSTGKVSFRPSGTPPFTSRQNRLKELGSLSSQRHSKSRTSASEAGARVFRNDSFLIFSMASWQIIK